LKDEIQSWKELNYQLFWNDVESKRIALERNGEILNSWYQVRRFNQSWVIDESDFDYFFEQITSRKLIDDKKIAISLCVSFSNQSKVEKTLGLISDEELVPHYHAQIKQKNDGIKYVSSQKNEEAKRIEKINQNRQKEIKHYQDNHEVLKDISYVTGGNLNALQGSMLSEFRRLDTKGSSKWGLNNTNILIEEFGETVMNSFRSGCVAYWKQFKPSIKSEKTELSSSTPAAIVFGLCGLAFEGTISGEWVENLSEEQVELACRYALNEINGLPDWFEGLAEKHPGIVKKIFLNEVRWELFENNNEYHDYVIYEIVSRARYLIPLIINDLVELLHDEVTNEQALHEALRVIISYGNFDIEKFISLTHEKIQSKLNNEQYCQWLAVSMNVDANTSVSSLLEEKLDSFKGEKEVSPYENTQAVEFLCKFLIYLNGSGTNNVTYIQVNYQNKPKVLEALIKLVHKYMPIYMDVKRESGVVYSPETKDEAQKIRNKLTEYLIRIPGRESYYALMGLSKTLPESEYQKYYIKYAQDKAAQDAEFKAWDEAQIIEYEEKFSNNYQEKKHTIGWLYKKVFRACDLIQKNKEYWSSGNLHTEPERNRQISTMLEAADVHVQQERPSSISPNGKADGELDFYIVDAGLTPVTIMEALNLDSIRKDYLNNHLDKVFSYDSNGLNELFFLVYSDAANFSGFYQKYLKHIESYDFKFPMTNSLVSDSEFSEIKLLKTSHERSGETINLNHLIINFKMISANALRFSAN